MTTDPAKRIIRTLLSYPLPSELIFRWEKEESCSSSGGRGGGGSYYCDGATLPKQISAPFWLPSKHLVDNYRRISLCIVKPCIGRCVQLVGDGCCCCCWREDNLNNSVARLEERRRRILQTNTKLILFCYGLNKSSCQDAIAITHPLPAVKILAPLQKYWRMAICVTRTKMPTTLILLGRLKVAHLHHIKLDISFIWVAGGEMVYKVLLANLSAALCNLAAELRSLHLVFDIKNRLPMNEKDEYVLQNSNGLESLAKALRSTTSLIDFRLNIVRHMPWWQSAQASQKLWKSLAKLSSSSSKLQRVELQGHLFLHVKAFFLNLRSSPWWRVLRLDLKKCSKSLTNEDLKCLSHRLPPDSLVHFEIQVAECEQINDEGFSYLVQSLYSLKILESLDLCFIKVANLTDSGIYALIDVLSVSAKALSSIKVNFQDCPRITKPCIRKFSDSLQSR